MIYLASQSARRKELLKAAKIPFKIVSSNFDEQTISGNPVLTVMINALGKAAFVKIRPSKGVVIGADTIVYLKGKIYGKPRDKKDAVNMLYTLSNNEHSVFTGVALFDFETKNWKTFHVESKVRMKHLKRKDVSKYFTKVNPMDKAGAYAIQDHGDELIQKIKGSYTNVVGLPMERLKAVLRQMKRK